MNDNYRRYTVWGLYPEECEAAADKVDACMAECTGRNIISYQVIGEEEPLPYDFGFITDKALAELIQAFIVVEQGVA